MAPRKTSSGTYRPDIDGLRAIAILSVVAYHLGVTGVTGGFVGVDIFFVISGYLITSIIWREISSGRFSLVGFYERRVRRILPALAFVLIVTTIVSWAFLLPQEFADYAKSLLAAVASCSNILFWQQSGYFGGANEFKPLLHTWSLGVEEQFYLFLPLFLMLVGRYWKKSLPLWIAFIAFVSFAISEYGVLHFSVGAFYLLDSRAWELMMGSALAIGMIPEIKGTVARNIASAVGLILIVIADFRLTSFTLFPGAAALLPCCGSLLIMAAGMSGSSVVGKILGFRPISFVGLISYSLYLWHWPLVVLARMGLVSWISFDLPHARFFLFSEMLAIAVLSWLFVERPFRSGPRAPGRKILYLTAGLTYAPLGLFATVVLLENGIPHRFPPEAVRIASFETNGGDRWFEREGSCMVDRSSKADRLDVDKCLKYAPQKQNVLLFGDSHAAHLWYGLSQEFPELNLMQATAATCRPLINVAKAEPYCQNLRDFIFGEYLPTHHIDLLVLAAAWTPPDLAPLAATLDKLNEMGIKVYLIGPVPGYDVALPRLLVQSIMRKDASLPYRHLDRDAWHLDDEMRNLAMQKHIARYISVLVDLCPNHACVEYAKPLVPMESDRAHFTAEGSLVLAKELRAANEFP